MKATRKIIGVSILALTITSVQANTVDFTTPSGSSGNDGPLSAEAIVTAVSGGVTVTLKDLLQNPTSAGQLVSGLLFDITGATGAGTVSGSGKLADIGAGGSYTAPGSASSLTHWASSLSGSTIRLTTLSSSQPDQLIIGPDNAGGFTGAGKYSNANSSIDNFNPSVLGTATFSLTIPGVTSGSTISNVRIQFGTAPETTIGTPVPDGGSTVALLGLSMFGIAILGRKLVRN
jgi:protein with PEP-CTERM/exosortase system signal